MNLINLQDFEDAARSKLDAMALGYYASGADDEVTLHDNREAYNRIKLHYHTLVDVSACDLTTKVLGTDISMPVIVAPTAFHRLAHKDGELATVRAAGSAATIMVLSTLSNTNVEDVVANATAPVWFQLYVYRDRDATLALVERVRDAGCAALVLTVDAPVLGQRERDVRNHFRLPAGMRVTNMSGLGLGDLPDAQQQSGLAAYFASLIDPSLTWKDIDWLRSAGGLPIIIKGIVRADDARMALEHGVDGIVVSNHGGRQLDTAPATIDVLAGIADAVGGKVEVFLDGGVRRGTDIVKALALGARAVLVGRPILWGLVVDGESGVARVLEMLRVELGRAMALCGCPDVASVNRGLVDPKQK